MKNKTKKIFYIALGFIMTTPYSVLAALENNPKITIDFKNPLKADSFQGLLNALLQILIQLGAVIAVLAFVFVGFQFISARGNTTKIEEARRNLWYVVIGTIILLGAQIITTVIGGTVDQLKS